MKRIQVGRAVVSASVRKTLNLTSDRQADGVVNAVTDSILQILRENIHINGFELRLPRFGKFVVRHKLGKQRRIPLTGKTQQTADKRKVKFLPVSEFRALESWPDNG